MNFKFLASLFAATALLAFVGCQPGPDEEDGNPVGEGVTSFTATINTPEVSRALLNGGVPTWKAGDNMLILSYNGATITNFKSTINPSTIKGSSATFNAASGRSIPKDRETYSVYPYFQPKLADVSGGKAGSREFKISLDNQKPSFDGKINLPLLIGYWDDATESFEMMNPLLTVKVNLSLPENEADLTLKRVGICGNNDEIMWGTSASYTTDDKAVKFAEEGAVKSLSFDCDGQVLGAAGKSITFCIPAAEYTKGITVKFYFLEGVLETFIRPEGINFKNDAIIEEDFVANITKSSIFVEALQTTDTTVAVAWTINKQNIQYLSQIYPNANAKYTEDIAKEYKVAIYSDEECSQLVYSAAVLKGESLFQESVCPPRFIFAGLAPQTDYYIHVHNITDGKQTPYPFKVTTAASVATSNTFAYTKPGDIILFENFGDFVYGGDIAARAAGVTRSDRGSLTSFSGVDLKGELNLNYEAVDGTTQAYVAAAASVEMGLFNTLKGLVTYTSLRL